MALASAWGRGNGLLKHHEPLKQGKTPESERTSYKMCTFHVLFYFQDLYLLSPFKREELINY